MELNRATKGYGAYVDDEFAGVLLADMKGEVKRYHSIWRSVFVKIFDRLQRIAAGKGVNGYDNANHEMLSSFCKYNNPDGAIIFLAADPERKVKGVGTALLSAFEAEENGFIFIQIMLARIHSMNAEDLTIPVCRAVFEGKTIPCISAKGQKLFHSGYELRDKDKHDISVLESITK